MSGFYFDSSALVKIYIAEAGSAWVANKVHGNFMTAWIAKIGIVESAAAIARQERMQNISLSQRDLLYQKLLYDSRNRLTLLAESNKIVSLAADLTQRAALRGYDAVHLAAALELNHRLVANRVSPLTFVSADAKLCQAALAEGLLTENPNDHP
ncbi:MAG: type II toxin-antitoxin system VapC family toxin [Chloroflexi bacterium]|nr:type II toxin-antitoxin system VapC family toxin [Chloroflexota bacterium]